MLSCKRRQGLFSSFYLCFVAKVVSLVAKFEAVWGSPVAGSHQQSEIVLFDASPGRDDSLREVVAVSGERGREGDFAWKDSSLNHFF